MKKINLTGQRFGRLCVQTEAGKRGKHLVWVCLCDCGKQTIVSTTALRQGKQLSCGCLRDEKLIQRSIKHGASRNYKMAKEYKAWAAAKQRCENPNDRKYYRYGARGIKMCDRWRNSFSNFLEDMGDKKPKTSLERINLDGNYEPGNCIWASMKTQMNNTSKNIRVEFNGEVKTLSEWAAKLGIDYKRLHYFYHRKGKTLKEIVNENRAREK